MTSASADAGREGGSGRGEGPASPPPFPAPSAGADGIRGAAVRPGQTPDLRWLWGHAAGRGMDAGCPAALLLDYFSG